MFRLDLGFLFPLKTYTFAPSRESACEIARARLSPIKILFVIYFVYTEILIFHYIYK